MSANARNGIGLDRVSNVVQAIASTTRFRTLVALLVATELIDDLRGAGPWVVLAPSEEAFARLPVGCLESCFRPERVEALVDLAENHVCMAPGRGEPLVSLLGQRLAVPGYADRGGEHVRVLARRACANGAVIEVDRPLFPRSLGGARIPAVRYCGSAVLAGDY